MSITNVYCMSCFSLPKQWPSEAKELVCDLYRLVRERFLADGKSEDEAWDELRKKHGLNISNRERDMVLEECCIQGVHIEVNKGDLNAPLPKEEWHYFLYEDENFDPDLASWIMDIVTARYEIPYKDRIEIPYCFYSDKPYTDFSIGKVVSCFEPLQQYVTDTLEAEEFALPRCIEREKMFYSMQIDDLKLPNEDKLVMRLALDSVMHELLEAGKLYAWHDKEPRRIYSVRETHRRLLEALHNIERLRQA